MLAFVACTFSICASADAQRPRFDDFFASQGQGTGVTIPAQNFPVLPGNQGSIITTPPVQINPPPGIINGGIINGGVIPNFGNQGGIIPGGIIQGPVITGPAIGTGVTAPQFDPRTPNQPFPIFPRATQPPPVLNFPPANTQPRNVGGNTGQVFQPPALPRFQQPALPQYNPNLPRYNPPQYGTPLPQAPNRWPYEGTGTNWLPSVDWTWPQQAWRTFRTQFLPRVLERPRVRQTYLHGSNGNELNINDIEIATTATLPNFFGGNQPLRISPGFIFHYWDGPDSKVYPAFDLPARAYSTYLAFDHITDPTQNSGFEGNFTVGYYSDFNNTSSDAIRLTSKMLGWRRVNPYTVAKLGVEYLDRVDVKLLPAGGFYLTPNADMKFDLYFPKTKLSHRVPNIGDLEAWAYLGAEYGGGSWAIERRNGDRDQADINDVRAFLGVEWMGPRRVTGFFEFGYAFDREIVYRSNALNKLDLQDTLMVRSGIAF